MTSSIDPSIPPLKPVYPAPHTPSERNEPPALQALISHLKLQPHIEGGYFVETDRDASKVPNPFLKPTPDTPTTLSTATGSVSATDPGSKSETPASVPESAGGERQQQLDTSTHRNASTTIYYLLTPASPQGAFHRNRGRTIHTLHRGRGRYVVIHADEVMTDYDVHTPSTGTQRRASVETFVVGHDVLAGERLQWIVEGAKYKGSFLLPTEGADGLQEEQGGLLISETVTPGFMYEDHDFMREERLLALVDEAQARELAWLLRQDV